MRVFWLTLGLVSLLLGLAGIVLPLLPTTPFLLLAAFSFARSSPTLHNWLLQHPKLGPPILDWQQEGAIQTKTKITAVVLIAATFILSLVLGVKTYILIIQAVILTAVTVFILSRPTPS